MGVIDQHVGQGTLDMLSGLQLKTAALLHEKELIIMTRCREPCQLFETNLVNLIMINHRALDLLAIDSQPDNLLQSTAKVGETQLSK